MSLLKNTILQGKCDLIGHKVYRSKISSLFSGEKDLVTIECDRCYLKLDLTLKNNKPIIVRKY